MIHISTDTRNFIKEHLADDVRTLALQSLKYPLVDMPTAVTQIAGRRIAIEKLPSWALIDDIVYPRHLSLEQCSSEPTARYKAGLVKGDTLTDLTGGFGIDCAFLSAGFKEVAYVERQADLCNIAVHNYRLLGLNHIRVRNEDSVAYLREMKSVDCIFIDPARRNEHGGKTVAISDCEPDVAALEELLLDKAANVMIKLSPMLDLSLALRSMRYVREVHIVSVNNECKELLLMVNKKPVHEIPIHCINFTSSKESHNTQTTTSTAIHCINLTSTGIQKNTFTQEQERHSECEYADRVGNYLFEPNASIMKAGAFRTIASFYKIRKLHPNSHLYTSDEQVNNFPGRTFRVIGFYSFNKKEIKELSDIGKANIAIRNFPASVSELRKRIKLAEGGNDYLFATTLNNEQKVLIRCTKE